MQISNNHISFGTSIKFVSPLAFWRVANKIEKINGCQIIEDLDITGNPPFGYRENVDLGGTGFIRSCTAGVTVKKGESAPLFWHIFDCPENINAFPVIENKLKGDNAILIGSKSAYYDSNELGNKFQEALSKKSIPTTILRDIAFRWQAFIAYISKDDTMYLCVSHCNNPFKYVKSMKDLKNVFSSVKISDTDNIEFMSFKKELFITQGIKP